MFTSRNALISLVAAAACFAIPAEAADGMFTAAMDGAQCLPDPIKTPATGTVELRLSADGKKIDYRITLDKLSNPSQADLHVGAAILESTRQFGTLVGGNSARDTEHDAHRWGFRGWHGARLWGRAAGCGKGTVHNLASWSQVITAGSGTGTR